MRNLKVESGTADASDMRRRLLPLLCTLSSLALLAAGCGGGESGSSGSSQGPLPAVKSLSQAAAATKKQGSYRFDMTMKMTMPGLPGPVEVTADGAVDTSGRRATMSMDLGSLADMAGAQLGNISADDLRVDAMFDWPVMYMRMPFLSKQLPGGAEWVKLDVEELAKRQGVQLPGFGSIGQNDPSAFLDFLKAATPDLRNLGPAKIDGVETTHYLARIDLNRYVSRLPKAQRKQLEPALAQLDQFTSGGQVRPLVDAWVDAEGLVRRFAMTLSLPSGTQQAEMSLQMDLHDFGTSVEVTAPPADKVADLGALAGLGG
jgi:hypothetical protein